MLPQIVAVHCLMLKSHFINPPGRWRRRWLLTHKSFSIYSNTDCRKLEQIDFLKHINHLIFIDRLTIKRLSSMKRGLSISQFTQNMKVSQSLLDLDLGTTSTSNIREIKITRLIFYQKYLMNNYNLTIYRPHIIFYLWYTILQTMPHTKPRHVFYRFNKSSIMLFWLLLHSVS